MRTLIVDDEPIARKILREELELLPDIEIVGEVADESDISASVKKTLPNVVVIALDKPGIRPPICDELLREHHRLVESGERAVVARADGNVDEGFALSGAQRGVVLALLVP